MTFFELNRLNMDRHVLDRCHKCKEFFVLGNMVISVKNPNEGENRRILFHKFCYRFMVRLGSVGLK